MPFWGDVHDLAALRARVPQERRALSAVAVLDAIKALGPPKPHVVAVSLPPGRVAQLLELLPSRPTDPLHFNGIEIREYPEIAPGGYMLHWSDGTVEMA